MLKPLSAPLACLLLFGGSSRAVDAEWKAAVGKGLELVQKAGSNWIKNKACFACHHQTLPMLAVVEGGAAGFPPDKAWMKEQADYTHEYFRVRIEMMHKGEHVPGGAFTVSYGLWALELADRPADETTTAMVANLLKIQGTARLKDRETGKTGRVSGGRWAPSCTRPPLQKSEVEATALCMAGIAKYAAKEQAEGLADARKRAGNWIAQASFKSNEDRAGRLWDALKRGDEPAMKAARDDLLAAQREDGGWSQEAKMASDAYATGQSLYTLRRAGLERDHPAAHKAAEWLRKAQLPDGSWLVETRVEPVQKFFENGDPHGRHQFLSTAATAWATAALARMGK